MPEGVTGNGAPFFRFLWSPFRSDWWSFSQLRAWMISSVGE